MSLGVPGMTFDPGWNNVFANLATTLILKNTVFVVAAGNEGATQTKNVSWLPLNPAVIIVGSVDLEGTSPTSRTVRARPAWPPWACSACRARS